MPTRAKPDFERFAALEAFEAPETAQQRQARLANARQNAQMTQSVIAEHEMREDTRMRLASRRAKNNMLSLNDLMGGLGSVPLDRADVMLPGMNAGSQFLTEEFPTNHDAMIMEDLYTQQQARPIRRQIPQQQPNKPQRQMLQETQPLRQPLRPRIKEAIATENWRIKRYLGETRGGNEVHVWKVENGKTGSSLRNLFRIEGVASRIAMILNESGDTSDPRVVSLISAYEKRDKLLKEARTLEKTANGKEMKSDRLRALRAEINQLDYRLGV